MKICLVLHGYPPELVGGTESAAQALARGLVSRGHEVLVVAGSIDHGPVMRISEEVQADGVRVVRLHRADLYFDHWQKSYSSEVSEAFAALLAKERPDLVHVHHWIRLSRDLVATAAEAGIVAVATLHDYWSTCLVTFRVRPDTHEACEATLAPDPCLSCAALVPPRTPWVERVDQAMALAEHRGDLARELELARAVIAPTAAHARAVSGFLGLDVQALRVRVVPHGRDLPLSPRQPDEEAAGDKLVLASWGNLHPLKGFDLVLGALASLDDPSGVRLHVAGREVLDDHTARLRELADGLDVVFHGAFDVADLAAHPAGGAHVMVSGTRARESWGLVLDEACGLGMPMILPRSGAYAERLSEGAGCLFYEPGDAGSLARCVQRLLDEPELLAQLRRDLPPIAKLAPSSSDHVEAVLGVYEEALAQGPPTAPQRDWWERKLRRERERAWDLGCSESSVAELGFE